MVIGFGRLPDGGKIVELRKRDGSGNDCYCHRNCSESFPRRDHSPRLERDGLDDNGRAQARPDQTQLKLRAVRSASELSNLAGGAHRYNWDLSVDPTAATAKEMQQLLLIIRRLVEQDYVTDEFDKENVTTMFAPTNFKKFTRLARLQELLDSLLAGGVGVLAGSYYNHSWTNLDDRAPAPSACAEGE